MSQPDADLMSPQRELDLRRHILLIWAPRLLLGVFPCGCASDGSMGEPTTCAE